MKKLTTLLLSLSFALVSGFSVQQAMAYEDPVIGDASALIHLELFQDYQCPFCARFHENLISDQIWNNYIATGALKITIKDFPLTSIHRNAQNAARAVNSIEVIHPELLEEYIGRLFENQSEWSNVEDPQNLFYKYAQEAGDIKNIAVSKNSFVKYYVDFGNSSEIQADIDRAKSREVTGTPTYFINGKKYSGSANVETLREQIELALKNVPAPETRDDFWAKSELQTSSGLIKVSWNQYPHSNLKYYKIRPSSTDLVKYPSGSEAFAVPQNSIKHFEIFDTNYYFPPQRSRMYFITIEAYDHGDTLLASTKTQVSSVQRGFDCPVYEKPSCPNGTVISPPAADGCPGKPYCKIEEVKQTDTPPAGFEEEVKTYRPEDNPFSDTDTSRIQGQAALELYNRGVIGGFPDGEFKGTRAVNRAEAAKFLLLSKNITIPQTILRNPFSDVISTEWYGPYVIEASNKGIIFGYEDGNFRPDKGVQTDEFLAMMARTFGLPTQLPYDYEDEDEYPIGSWFWSYAGIAQKYDLFPNRGNRLAPGRHLTRDDVAIAIYQYLKNR